MHRSFINRAVHLHSSCLLGKIPRKFHTLVFHGVIRARDDSPHVPSTTAPATTVSHYRQDGPWRDLLLFHEIFHPDTGQGFGASHQTDWTARVARLIRKK
jgi:hypothetical protein